MFSALSTARFDRGFLTRLQQKKIQPIWVTADVLSGPNETNNKRRPIINFGVAVPERTSSRLKAFGYRTLNTIHTKKHNYYQRNN
jgi:hypothetical protein